MTKARALAILKELRVSWSVFLRRTKTSCPAADTRSDDALANKATELAQTVTHLTQDEVASHIIIAPGGKGAATVTWGTGWALTLVYSQRRVWLRLMRGGLCLAEGEHGESLWAEMWGMVCKLEGRNKRTAKRRPLITQLQKKLMRLH